MSEKTILLALILLSLAGLVLVYLVFLNDDTGGDVMHAGEAGSTATGDDRSPPDNETGDDWSDPEDEVAEKVKLEAAGTTGGEHRGAPGRGAGVVTGRVVGETGAPIEGALVALGGTDGRVIFDTPGVQADMPGAGDGRPRFREQESEPEPAEKPACTSGRDGRFRLEGVGRADRLLLRLSHENHVPLRVEVNAFDGRSRDMGDLVLELGGSISGLIINAAGRPLAGAEAMARPVDEEGGSFLFDFSLFAHAFDEWNVTTDENGFYTIRGIPPGMAQVRASHPEHAPAKKTDIAVIRGKETGGVDIVLPWGLAISGRVIDADGEPLAGVDIAAARDLEITLQNLNDLENIPFDLVSSLKPVKSDESGLFRLHGLAEGRYTVKAAAESYAAKEEKKVAAGTDDLVLVLQKGGRLVGRIVDAGTGAGIESFFIDVTQYGYDEDAHELLKGEAAAARSDEPLDPAGAFCIQGLGEDAFDIAVEAEGYADETINGLRAAPGRGTVRNIELFPESVISGRLLTAAGEPAAEGSVRLETPSAGTEPPPDPAALQEASALIPGIEGAAELLSNRWDGVKTARSGEDGAFVFRGIREGRYRVKGSHRMHAGSEPVELILARGEKAEGLEVRLSPSGSIAGTAFAVDGTPLPGARVQVSKGGGLLGLLAAGADGNASMGLNSETSDGEGRFRFDGLEPGAYVVWMQSPGDGESLSGLINSSISGLMGQGIPGAREVRVEAGEVAEVELHETLKSRIEGAVSEAGRPVPGMKVNLLDGDLGFLAIVPLKSTSTDANGLYLFDDLEEGRYDVRLDVMGLAEQLKESIHIGGGETGILNFALPTGRVAGRVVDAATGQPLAGMKVSLERTDRKGGGLLGALGLDKAKIEVRGGDMDSGDALQGLFGNPPVLTGGDGRFEIRFVEEGEYALTVAGKGYIEETRSPVKVAAGGEAGFHEFRLAMGFTVTGRVTEGATGAALDRCNLTCERIAKGEPEPEKVKSFTSGANGRFTLTGLAPGAYRLKGETHGLEGEEVFIINETDVKDLELVLW